MKTLVFLFNRKVHNMQLDRYEESSRRVFDSDHTPLLSSSHNVVVSELPESHKDVSDPSFNNIWFITRASRTTMTFNYDEMNTPCLQKSMAGFWISFQALIGWQLLDNWSSEVAMYPFPCKSGIHTNACAARSMPRYKNHSKIGQFFVANQVAGLRKVAKVRWLATFTAVTLTSFTPYSLQGANVVCAFSFARHSRIVGIRSSFVIICSWLSEEQIKTSILCLFCTFMSICYGCACQIQLVVAVN